MELKAQFDQGQAAIARLAKGEYDLAEATKIGDKTLGCIDEGIEYACYRLAGSGRLLGEEQAVALVEKFGLDVGYHSDCGAVRKYLVEGAGVLDPSDEEVDAEAKRWSEQIARMAKTKAVEMPLERPEHHIALCAYYDGTGQMTSCKGLPLGFIVSRTILPHDYAIAEMVTATDIATNHGFNDLFTHEHPFLLVAVGRDQDQAQELEEELKTHALRQLTESQQGRVKVISIHLQRIRL